MPTRAHEQNPAAWLSWLMLGSGAVQLAGEALWHRMASILVGDWALSTTIVWSIFFLGSALGALLGQRFIRMLWMFEALPAIWSLGWAIAIRLGALELAITPWEMGLIMIPPAIAMGAHIPAYASLSGGRAARSWSLWHAGGALGIFLLAAAPGNLTLSTQLIGLAAIQFCLAVALFRFLGRDPNLLGCRAAPAVLQPRFALADLAVLAVGFFAASWMAAALLQLSFLTLPLRLVGAAAIAASTLAACLGGLVAGQIPAARAWILPAGAAGLASAMIWISGWTAEWLLPQADVTVFGLAMLLLAFLLMLPIALTGAWYIKCADQTRSFGRILAYAALGNAGGFVAAYSGGMEIAGISGLVAAVLVASLAAPRLNKRRWLHAAVGAALLAATLQPMIQGSFHWPFRRDGIFENKTGWMAEADVVIRRVTPSWWMVAAIEQNGYRAAEISMHGASSHNMAGPSEYASTLIGGSYLPDGRSRRTLVLGILSGQTSIGAASFSTHVDAVDVARASIDAVTYLKDWNLDVARNPKVTFIIEDALTVLKTCPPGTYDLIVNGTSSPSVPAAGKMFSDEAVKLAKRCLTDDGVFVSFLSKAATADLAAGDMIIRPVKRHFAHVDLTLEPYPLIIGYGDQRDIDHQAMVQRMLERAPDFAALAASHAPLFFPRDDRGTHMTEVRILKDYQPRAGDMPTLDNGLAESASVPTYLRAIAGAPFSTVSEELEALYRLTTDEAPISN